MEESLLPAPSKANADGVEAGQDQSPGLHYGSTVGAINDAPPGSTDSKPRGTRGQMTLRARAYDLVNGEADSWFEYLILFLIFANVVLFMVGTVPATAPKKQYNSYPACISYGPDLATKHAHLFNAFETVSVIIFSIEYVLRIWSCLEDRRFAAKGPVLGRIHQAFAFFCFIDFVSIAPFYITLIPGVPDARFTTALRGFRLIRLLKADKYVNAFALLAKVIYDNGSLLIAAMFYAIVCLLVFSTLLYYSERHNHDPDMKCHFTSVPASIFPTLLMLTGEFPLSAFTPLGQFFGSLIAFVAVAIFAVPTGVIGSGFVKAVQDARGREFTVDA